MSEGIDAYTKKKFEVPDVDIRTYSPLTLAYIGDGVFELVTRTSCALSRSKMVGCCCNSSGGIAFLKEISWHISSVFGLSCV